MSAVFDYIQTFYLDKDRVSGAAEILMTSVDLFFKSKPSLVKNASGSANPVVTVWVCDIDSDSPIPTRVVKDSISIALYDLVNTTANASSATKFKFRNPIKLTAGRYYGLVIKFSDPGFEVWTNKQGDLLVDASGVTGNPSPGSQSRFDGKLYKSNNSSTFQEFADRDLKFKLNIAKFSTSNNSIYLVNKDYEFFTIGSTVGNFKGGEWVYQNTANATGTLSVSSTSKTITGSGTTLTNLTLGQYILIESGGVKELLKVENVVNATSMSVDRAPSFTSASIQYSVPPVGKVAYVNYTTKELYLVESNAANTTFKFATNNILKGQISNASANLVSIDRLAVDSFTPKLKVGSPSSSKFTLTYSLANNSNNIESTYNLENYKENASKRASYILSRSNEVVGTSLFGTTKKSAVINVVFNPEGTANPFTAPVIDGDELDFFTYHYDINNTYTETRYSIPDFDTETQKNGLALSKYISKKISFAKDKYAEDVSVFVTAYRPFGSEIRVYAKIQNTSDNEAFDDKSWTPLELKDNVDKYSRTSDEFNLIEYTYGFAQYPQVKQTIDVNLTVNPASANVATGSNITASVSVGDLVRLYDPLLPNNHEVFSVVYMDATTLGLNKLVSNPNIPTNPGLDVLKYSSTAFNNIANDNVVRYYTTSTNQEVDGFNAMQVKVVLLSSNTHLTPKVEQIQAIGVSA